MEPSEGMFNFTWLDAALLVLSKYNISAILGTPTASPPAWLIAKYPEMQVFILSFNYCFIHFKILFYMFVVYLLDLFNYFFILTNLL